MTVDELIAEEKQLNEEINKQLSHIKQPLSTLAIKRIYVSGAYEAEMLLQHTLRNLQKMLEEQKHNYAATDIGLK